MLASSKVPGGEVQISGPGPNNKRFSVGRSWPLLIVSKRFPVGRCAPLRVLRRPVLAHVEVLDLAHYSRRHLPLFCVEARHEIDAALSRNQLVEEGVGVVPERGEGAKASDDDLRGPAPIKLRDRPPVAARGSVRGTARPGMAPFAAWTGPPASRGPQHDLR